MKELPVLCLAIIAIVFIHATNKSDDKNTPNRNKTDNRNTSLNANVDQVVILPKFFFAGNKISEGLTEPKVNPILNVAEKLPGRSVALSTANHSKSLEIEHCNSVIRYDPSFLFFHQRVKFSYGAVMAVK